MVGATGFEQATPCAQGKLGRVREVLFLERFAAFKKRCDQIWDQPSRDALLRVAINGERASSFGGSSWDNGHMPKATIAVDAALKERLADLAGKTGQPVDEFVEALLRRIAGADVNFERECRSFRVGVELRR